MADGRWPPVYDPEDVKRAIETLTAGLGLAESRGMDATLFYWTADSASGALCQGDVVRLTCGLPAIDDEGEVSVAEEVDFWFVTGNTCDYNRSVDEVPSFLAAPVYALPDTTPQARLQDLRRYCLSREFYLPRWAGAPSGPVGFFADLTKTATLSRRLLEPAEGAKKRCSSWFRRRERQRAAVVGRLSKEAWFLLNAALIRFLARDDGRYEA